MTMIRNTRIWVIVGKDWVPAMEENRLCTVREA